MHLRIAILLRPDPLGFADRGTGIRPTGRIEASPTAWIAVAGLAIGQVVMVLIMVMTPLIVPPLYAAGVDPVHLGVVVVLNLMIGLVTPPVGMSLYMVSIISNVPFTRMAKVIWPFLVPLLVALVVITLFPTVSTWLPALVFQK